MSRDATAVHVGGAGVDRQDGDVDPGPSCGLPFFILGCLNRFTTRAPPGRIEITSTLACDSVSCGILLSVLNAVVVSTACAAEITFRVVVIHFPSWAD